MNYFRWLIAFLIFTVGMGWLLLRPSSPAVTPLTAASVTTLSSKTVASMDSAAFDYSAGWQINAIGADPSEPSDPFQTPAGVLTFTYQGSELALLLATGDYWGYLYVTVDGKPANQLATIAGNVDSQQQPAAYKPLYDPENQRADGAGTQWIRVHRDFQPSIEHQVRLEIWRSWGQIPIRAVGIDALPAAPIPLWPAVALILLAATLLVVPHLRAKAEFGGLQPHIEQKIGIELWIAIGALTIIAVAVVLDLWWLCLIGLVPLALVSVVSPVLWLATFLFGLPFYFNFTLPLFPNRSLGIVDVGILGGIAVTVGHLLVTEFQLWKSKKWQWEERIQAIANTQLSRPPLLWMIAGWSLVATAAALHFDVALHEWRTVFLSAAIFAALLNFALTANPLSFKKVARQSMFKISQVQLVIGAWILGGVAIAGIGLWAYATHYESYLVAAEGVTRLRAVYGSPNNLAAYLERSVAVCLALAFFATQMRIRILATLAALPQLIALLLTFSKGGIFLGMPAMMATLALAGVLLLRRQGRPVRFVWGLFGLALLGGLVLIPVIGSERFRGLLDPSSATSLMRINLWRSSWQMALDHPWLGVGPDNFLYIYRSGYLLPEAWKEPNLNHPHNFILDWWTRLGLIGLLLGLAWWGGMIQRLWKSITSGASSALEVGLFAATFASLAHGLIDINYALPDLMIVWVLIGALAGGQGGAGDQANGLDHRETIGK